MITTIAIMMLVAFFGAGLEFKNASTPWWMGGLQGILAGILIVGGAALMGGAMWGFFYVMINVLHMP